MSAYRFVLNYRMLLHVFASHMSSLSAQKDMSPHFNAFVFYIGQLHFIIIFFFLFCLFLRWITKWNLCRKNNGYIKMLVPMNHRKLHCARCMACLPLSFSHLRFGIFVNTVWKAWEEKKMSNRNSGTSFIFASILFGHLEFLVDAFFEVCLLFDQHLFHFP